MLEALIGGGVKLLGGLFASRSAKKARAQALQDQALQFVRLRDAAEAAGFNPLTVLGANPQGGMVNPTPALASGEFVADALDTGIQTYFNAKQRERDVERDQLEKALMRQELAQMQAQGKAFTRGMSFGYEIPQANNYTGVDRAAATPDLSRSGSGGMGDGLIVAGIPVTQNQNFSDAQKIEDRYGDVASWAYGLGVIGADAYSTGQANNVGGFLADAGAAFWKNMPKPKAIPQDRIRVSRLPDYQWAKPGRTVQDEYLHWPNKATTRFPERRPPDTYTKPNTSPWAYFGRSY